MDLALHHPTRGYYQRAGRTPFGQRGDFTTAPLLADAPGRAIARWIKTRLPPWPARAHLIEPGAGMGALADAVLGGLGPLDRLRTRCHLVDSPERVRQALARSSHRRRVTAHHRMTDAVRGLDHAIVFHNELVDAFPCRVLVRHHSQWLESFLRTAPDGRLTESLDPPRDTGPWSFSSLGWNAPDGQRVEIHPAYFDWLATWTPLLKSFEMLTIDYGAGFPEIHHRRPHGTLRGHFHHMPVGPGEITARPGHQDITADVNFTDLITNARALGIESDPPVPLAEFLNTHLPPTPSPTPAESRLRDPHDAGGHFLVLRQGKGSADF